MGGQARSGGLPRLLRVSDVAAVPDALDAAGLHRLRPVLVLVGGAGGMDEAQQQRVVAVLRDAVVPVLESHRAAVVDGGTDSGVMRMIGRARSAANASFCLVGVAAEGTVVTPGRGPSAENAAEPEPHHTHLVLVPGTSWGDESPWLTHVADALADGRGSVTVVINGGDITYADAAASIDRGRPVVVLAGTGRTADAIAGARAGQDADPRALAIAASSLTRIVALDDLAGVHDVVHSLLS